MGLYQSCSTCCEDTLAISTISEFNKLPKSAAVKLLNLVKYYNFYIKQPLYYVKSLSPFASKNSLKDLLSNNFDDFYSVQPNGEQEYLATKIQAEYINQLIEVFELYKNKEVHDYDKVTSNHIFQVIYNSTLSLMCSKSEVPGFDVFFSFKLFNQYVKSFRIFSELNGIFINAENRTIGALFNDGKFVANIDIDYNLVLYVSSYVITGTIWIFHNWVHFGFPDIVCYNISTIVIDKDSLLYEFLKPFNDYIPLTNQNGLSFGEQQNQIVRMFPKLTPFNMGDFSENIAENTHMFYQTFNLNTLFNVEKNKFNKHYIENQQKVFYELYQLVKAVYKRFSLKDKKELEQVFVNISLNIKGLNNTMVTEENVIRLLTKFLHIVSFVHAIDHQILVQTFKNTQCVSYFTEPLSSFKLEKDDVFLANLILQVVVTNGYPKSMDEYHYKDPTLNELFQIFKSKIDLSPLNLSLKDVTMSICY